jgi:hypothetical protein
MARRLRVMLEVGPKGKKVVAIAPDWPGLERGDKTGEAAVAKLRSYLSRYAGVAERAGMGAEFEASTRIEVVEEYDGVGSTDFWGISFAFSDLDKKKMPVKELDREMRLMRACWGYFDDVRGRVSEEMEKGPRGGGRDRDRIVRHVFATEQDWAKKLKIRGPHDEVVTRDDAVEAFRNEYCAAIKAFHSEGKPARTWPLRYLIRHTGYHTMDHAWEMEDKDMTRP